MFGRPVEWSSTVDVSHFTFDETVPDAPLTIKSVTLGDEGRYWCVRNTIGVGEEYGTSDMQIRGGCGRWVWSVVGVDGCGQHVM